MDPVELVKLAYEEARAYERTRGRSHQERLQAYTSFRDTCYRAGLHYQAVLDDIRKDARWPTFKSLKETLS
jgi:aminoglycoside phosphotransferase (APT) family kinase protein